MEWATLGNNVVALDVTETTIKLLGTLENPNILIADKVVLIVAFAAVAVDVEKLPVYWTILLFRAENNR